LAPDVERSRTGDPTIVRFYSTAEDEI